MEQKVHRQRQSKKPKTSAAPPRAERPPSAKEPGPPKSFRKTRSQEPQSARAMPAQLVPPATQLFPSNVIPASDIPQAVQREGPAFVENVQGLAGAAYSFLGSALAQGRSPILGLADKHNDDGRAGGEGDERDVSKANKGIASDKPLSKLERAELRAKNRKLPKGTQINVQTGDDLLSLQDAPPGKAAEVTLNLPASQLTPKAYEMANRSMRLRGRLTLHLLLDSSSTMDQYLDIWNDLSKHGFKPDTKEPVTIAPEKKPVGRPPSIDDPSLPVNYVKGVQGNTRTYWFARMQLTKIANFPKQ